MTDHEKVNILLVDDQPAKLLAYEVILKELSENLVMASSGREALEYLLKNDVAVILVDVCMPELDGFELAAMIREHPRFQKTAMIFISAIQVSDIDRLRGYEMGAVDYVPVPVIPEVLRAKIRVFAELYRKTRQLERLNAELEDRVRARTAELENPRAAAGKRAAPQPGDRRRQDGVVGLGLGQRRLDVGRRPVSRSSASIRRIRGDTGQRSGAAPSRRCHELRKAMGQVRQGRQIVRSRISHRAARTAKSAGASARRRRPVDKSGRVVRISGVTVDITERKQAEERQNLLAREVDHRAKNALALAQSIVRLTRGENVKTYVQRSKDASTRWRGCTPCCRCRAGRAPK